jgi:hypothetical protein
MRVNAGPSMFTVTGTVTLDTDWSPIPSAMISYTVNGGPVRTTTTDLYGRYVITASSGDRVEITGVTKSGHTRITPLPSPFTTNTVNVNFVMSLNTFTVIVTVISEEGGSIAYMKNNSGIWIMLTPDPVTGKYVIYGVEDGATLWIRGTPVDPGFDVIWIFFFNDTATAEIYTLTAKSDRNLEVVFDHTEDDNSWLFIALIILAAVIVGLLLFFIWWRRCIVDYLVTFGDDGLESVKIEYTVNGESREPLFTDSSGNYRIRVPKDSEVLISSVTRDGYVVSTTLPLRIIAEKGVVEASFVMVKK